MTRSYGTSDADKSGWESDAQEGDEPREVEDKRAGPVSQPCDTGP